MDHCESEANVIWRMWDRIHHSLDEEHRALLKTDYELLDDIATAAAFGTSTFRGCIEDVALPVRLSCDPRCGSIAMELARKFSSRMEGGHAFYGVIIQNVVEEMACFDNAHMQDMLNV